MLDAVKILVKNVCRHPAFQLITIGLKKLLVVNIGAEACIARTFSLGAFLAC